MCHQHRDAHPALLTVRLFCSAGAEAFRALGPSEFCQLCLILGERDNTPLGSSSFVSQEHCTDAWKLFAVTLVLVHEPYTAEDNRKSILSSPADCFLELARVSALHSGRGSLGEIIHI